MRGTITFDEHGQHAWRHFAIRLAIVLLLLFLILILRERVIGKTQKSASTRAEILEAEQLLNSLGYWTGPVDGIMDPALRQALIAFQKVEGRKRTGKLDKDELNALRTAPRPFAREIGIAHVEIDLDRQVLFYVDETGTVAKILPVSTGTGKPYHEKGQKGIARTPTGTFTVYRKINGWRKSPLGLLYYPSYFVGGYAIHGSPSVPPFPASHGCVRIPMYAAVEFSKLATIGTTVNVYKHTQVTLDSR